MQTLSLSELKFIPEITFTSGQTFRWRRIPTRRGIEWLGVVHGDAVIVNSAEIRCVASLRNRSEPYSRDFSEVFGSYFSFSDNLNEITKSFPRDQFLLDSVRMYEGLRILTQDPWECLVSFVCSINKNIPGITSMIELLSNRFGVKIVELDRAVYSFPSPSTLAKASKLDLLSCRVGFRWKYIQFIARQVASGRTDLYSLNSKGYHELRNELISDLSGKTFGVGQKVADCVSLFAYHRMEAFPIDVWILRCLKNHYAEELNLAALLEQRKTLSPKLYEAIRENVLRYFGEFCGYAQQYLYMRIRDDHAIQKTVTV
jgi:N-glycosylase/DNA lyase